MIITKGTDVIRSLRIDFDNRLAETIDEVSLQKTQDDRLHEENVVINML